MYIFLSLVSATRFCLIYFEVPFFSVKTLRIVLSSGWLTHFRIALFVSYTVDTCTRRVWNVSVHFYMDLLQYMPIMFVLCGLASVNGKLTLCTDTCHFKYGTCTSTDFGNHSGPGTNPPQILRETSDFRASKFMHGFWLCRVSTPRPYYCSRVNYNCIAPKSTSSVINIAIPAFLE